MFVRAYMRVCTCVCRFANRALSHVNCCGSDKEEKGKFCDHFGQVCFDNLLLKQRRKRSYTAFAQIVARRGESCTLVVLDASPAGIMFTQFFFNSFFF